MFRSFATDLDHGVPVPVEPTKSRRTAPRLLARVTVALWIAAVPFMPLANEVGRAHAAEEHATIGATSYQVNRGASGCTAVEVDKATPIKGSYARLGKFYDVDSTSSRSKVAVNQSQFNEFGLASSQKKIIGQLQVALPATLKSDMEKSSRLASEFANDMAKASSQIGEYLSTTCNVASMRFVSSANGPSADMVFVSNPHDGTLSVCVNESAVSCATRSANETTKELGDPKASDLNLAPGVVALNPVRLAPLTAKSLEPTGAPKSDTLITSRLPGGSADIYAAMSARMGVRGESQTQAPNASGNETVFLLSGSLGDDPYQRYSSARAQATPLALVAWAAAYCSFKGYWWGDSAAKCKAALLAQINAILTTLKVAVAKLFNWITKYGKELFTFMVELSATGAKCLVPIAGMFAAAPTIALFAAAVATAIIPPSPLLTACGAFVDKIKGFVAFLKRSGVAGIDDPQKAIGLASLIPIDDSVSAQASSTPPDSAVSTALTAMSKGTFVPSVTLSTNQQARLLQGYKVLSTVPEASTLVSARQAEAQTLALLIANPALMTSVVPRAAAGSALSSALDESMTATKGLTQNMTQNGAVVPRTLGLGQAYVSFGTRNQDVGSARMGVRGKIEGETPPQLVYSDYTLKQIKENNNKLFLYGVNQAAVVSAAQIPSSSSVCSICGSAAPPLVPQATIRTNFKIAVPSR